jgi:hypothetical protein
MKGTCPWPRLAMVHGDFRSPRLGGEHGRLASRLSTRGVLPDALRRPPPTLLLLVPAAALQRAPDSRGAVVDLNVTFAGDGGARVRPPRLNRPGVW